MATPIPVIEAPSTTPNKIKFAVPKGAFDTHFHMFGPLSKYPFPPTATYHSQDALPETYFAMQDAMGLRRGVLVSAAGYGRDYRHLVDTLKRFPDRLRGVVLAPDDVTDADLQMMNKAGVRAVRFFSDVLTGPSPKINPEVAARAMALGWHIVFFPHNTDIVEHKDRLLKTGGKIVLDHFASVPAASGLNQPAFKAVLEMLDTGRVWIKLSGPMRVSSEPHPYPSVLPMAQALVKHAPERILWGTDWPHPNLSSAMPNDGDLLNLLADWVPDAAIRKKVLVDNPLALYDFPPV